MLHTNIIPGLLSISSNKRKLKGFPLCEDLLTAPSNDGENDVPLRIKFLVNKSLRISNRREGKLFKNINEKTIGMEVPIGRMGNVTCAINFSNDCPELQVNPTLFRAGRITIGNVHSVAWMLRDLCNVHLLRNGYALIHGAALRSRSACVLLVGLSNTGKTTSVKRLVTECGSKTFGDDLVATDGTNAIACPYTAFNVAPPDLPRFADRAMQRARRAIPFYEYFAPTSKVTLVDYFGKGAISEPAKVDYIFFLRKSNRVSVSEMDKISAQKMLLASNAAEFTYSSNSLFNAYDFLMQSRVNLGALDAERELLFNLCSRAHCYLIDGNIDSFVAAVEDALLPAKSE